MTMQSSKLLIGLLRSLIRAGARLPTGSHECVICKHGLRRFLPYRGGSHNLPALTRALRMVGSDVDHFACPWCHAHDRERHLFLYMRETGIFDSLHSKRVLHFAPEPQLSRCIEDAGPDAYIRCDLYPWADGISKADLLALPFPDSHFDLLIANHVLEHVADDRLAVREITRVLRPGGYAILQTPFSSMLEHTWEDSGICLAEARLQAFGQEDHVRLFGRDIFERIAQQGLESLIKQHDAVLPGYCPKRYGLNPEEPFFLFRKPGEPPRLAESP
jgi:Methyltransferase domain